MDQMLCEVVSGGKCPAEQQGSNRTAIINQPPPTGSNKPAQSSHNEPQHARAALISSLR